MRFNSKVHRLVGDAKGKTCPRDRGLVRTWIKAELAENKAEDRWVFMTVLNRPAVRWMC